MKTRISGIESFSFDKKFLILLKKKTFLPDNCNTKCVR